MEYQAYIIRDRRISGGVPVVRGTRVPVKTILASLAAGDKVEDLLTSFPTLTEEAVWAVIAFAAASTVFSLFAFTLQHVSNSFGALQACSKQKWWMIGQVVLWLRRHER